MSKSLFDTLYDKYLVNDISFFNEPSEEELRSIKTEFNFLLPYLFRYVTPAQREIINMFYGEGYKQEAIARTKGIAQATVSRQLSSGVERLYKYFVIIIHSVLWGLRSDVNKD